MIKKVSIYGERCSGTNYLQQLIETNFVVTVTFEYGWKHFFGFNDLSKTNDTLFIGIIRNPFDWINSLYRQQHHLPQHFRDNIDNFLNSEFYSVKNDNSEFMSDRNIYTNKRYKNIFHMRYTKIKYLLEDMPDLVKHYIFIKYEDLLDDFSYTMNTIKNKGLSLKQDILFPTNITYDAINQTIPFVKDNKQNYISKEKIIEKLNIFYEKTIFNYDI